MPAAVFYTVLFFYLIFCPLFCYALFYEGGAYSDGLDAGIAWEFPLFHNSLTEEDATEMENRGFRDPRKPLGNKLF